MKSGAGPGLGAGALVAARFQLVEPLGGGGMGEVWIARDARLETPCAIKFLRSQTPADRARFAREAKAAAQLRSPNVVQILDHGEHEGVPYIAMELLDGEDLASRLRRLGCLAPESTFSIIEQVARALTRAHAAGLVHRDLKPANIFLIPDDGRELVKVLDFGIVKTLAGGAPPSARSPDMAARPASATQTGALMGTPHYMSPEQATASREIDTRADLWSLGIVTFQCLTGRLPFVSDDFADLVMKILLDPAPRPSDLRPDLPRALDAWFVRAIAREPGDRFQSARDFVDALAIALGISLPAPSGAETSAPPRLGPELAIATAPTVPAGVGHAPPPARLDATSTAATPPPKKRRALVAVIVGVALVSGCFVAFAIASGRARRTSPTKAKLPAHSAVLSSVASVASVASASARTAVTTPQESECGATHECKDVLHSVCRADEAGRHRCETSPAGASFSIEYEGKAAYKGGSSATMIHYISRDQMLAMRYYAVTDLDKDGAAAIDITLVGVPEVGTRSFGVGWILTVAEARVSMGSNYAGTWTCESGTLTISSIDYRAEGHVEGSIDCELRTRADVQPILAGHVHAVFYSVIPK